MKNLNASVSMHGSYAKVPHILYAQQIFQPCTQAKNHVAVNSKKTVVHTGGRTTKCS